MSIPRFTDKHGLPSICQPQDLLRYFSGEKRETWPGFTKCILLFQGSALQKLKSEADFSQASWLGLNFNWLKGSSTAIVTGIGMGAPALAMKVEELIALGVREFVLIGTAGGLQENLLPGSVIICDQALRDEGLSQHYLPPSESVLASNSVTTKLAGLLTDVESSFRGISWTTDAIYRETKGECDHYREHGVLCVEMEAAGLFAVAEYRQVEASAVFVISDLIHKKGWQPYLRDVRVKTSLYQVLKQVFWGMN